MRFCPEIFAIEHNARDWAASEGAVFFPPAGVGCVKSLMIVLRTEPMVGSSPRSNKDSAVYPTCFSEYLGDRNNTITSAMDAALAISPNSFEETNFRAPQFQTVPFTPDYTRIGPDIHGNFLDILR